MTEWIEGHLVYLIPIAALALVIILEISARFEERRWKQFERDRDEARRRAIFERDGL